jgi:hypothetical protein
MYLFTYSAAQNPIMKQERAKRQAKAHTHTHKKDKSKHRLSFTQ